MEQSDEKDEVAFPTEEPDDGPIRQDQMSWGDRMLTRQQTLSPRHRKLCELAAQGISNKKIAEQLHYTDSRVSILLSNTQIRNEVEKMREKIYEDTVGRRLKDMARPALDELDRCLGDSSGKYKEQLKVETAKWVVEKIDGKAIQKHDIGDNLLSVMMDRLDSMKQSGQKSHQTIDVSPSSSDILQIEGEIPEKEAIPVSKSEEDLLRDWCTDQFGTKIR